jgi:chemotaxis protein CheC
MAQRFGVQLSGRQAALVLLQQDFPNVALELGVKARPDLGRAREVRHAFHGHFPHQTSERAGIQRVPPGRGTAARTGEGMTATSTDLLNELQLDALTELVNLGVSRAASSLREMVGSQVLLSAPSVSLETRAGAIAILAEREISNLVAVHQVFEGDITGRALLIFPETKSLELVRAITGGDLPLEDIIELEQEALAESGNILLNSCLATIANMLQRSLKMSLPEVLHGNAATFFSLAPPPEAGDVVMFLYINFAIRDPDISGYIAMIMDLPSLTALTHLLDESSNGRPETAHDST